VPDCWHYASPKQLSTPNRYPPATLRQRNDGRSNARYAEARRAEAVRTGTLGQRCLTPRAVGGYQ